MRGMTWNHPRGHDPLVAASARWREMTGLNIAWDRRSLQDFETYPVEDLARRYDLIVIDHPHVGQVAATGCLLPLDTLVDAASLQGIAAGSIGASFESYLWDGQQWALPVDAAAQVSAWVPSRIAAMPAKWTDLAPLIADGRASLPLRPPHSLMSLFTLCGLSGIALDPSDDLLFPPGALSAFELLAAAAAQSYPGAFESDPIDMLEAMARPDSRLAVAPLIYGYVSYARAGFRPELIRFSDIPALDHGPEGSALGGTGIAVSAFGQDPAAAARFAAWVASGPVQRDIVAAHGGQPAHGDAWSSDVVNAASGDFYRGTRRTLDHAWLRPRHDGYMKFQDLASSRINADLRAGTAAVDAIAALNHLYRASR
ncbi:extracellular solute-binding protein [Sphingomonas humi]|uniref:Extracellular solute-binding protein n=1 Tax=Sphingomonas humi TaxID=335630 RepID=A0ABP7S3P3_9SPHN